MIRNPASGTGQVHGFRRGAFGLMGWFYQTGDTETRYSAGLPAGMGAPVANG